MTLKHLSEVTFILTPILKNASLKTTRYSNNKKRSVKGKRSTRGKRSTKSRRKTKTKRVYKVST